MSIAQSDGPVRVERFRIEPFAIPARWFILVHCIDCKQQVSMEVPEAPYLAEHAERAAALQVEYHRHSCLGKA